MSYKIIERDNLKYSNEPVIEGSQTNPVYIKLLSTLRINKEQEIKKGIKEYAPKYIDSKHLSHTNYPLSQDVNRQNPSSELIRYWRYIRDRMKGV